MRDGRVEIIDNIYFYADNSTTSHWPGDRSWEGIKKNVKGLVGRLREDPSLVTVETNKIMVQRGIDGMTVYINVGYWDA